MTEFKLHSHNDYQDILHKIIIPLDRFCYYKGNNINSFTINWHTSYTKDEEYLEFFSRTLLGIGLSNSSSETIEKYLLLIKKGITPNLYEYWGNCNDNSQMIVEMFPILHFCLRKKENFDLLFLHEDKKNFQQWFLQINKVKVCNNNWHFFPILVNLFLQKLELEYNQQIIEESWENIDRMYLGNGWYSDGDSKQEDYYNSFAFHFYSLLYAFYSNDNDRITTIKVRAKLFAQNYIHFFANTGESIPYGRSLTYKFAHIAFWSIYSLFIKDKQQLGIIKGIINRNIRWWFSKKIFNSSGLLINGYTYENPYMLEQYNGIGSPYWAFKAFFCMLEPNSDFFKVKELPYPEIPTTKLIPEANLCIHHYNGHSFAFINGQKNSYFCNKTAKYEKFVYSSLFGFNVSRSFETLDMLAPDNTLAIKIGNNIIVRNNARIIYNDEQIQISDWQPTPSVIIRTFIFMGAPWHIRIHNVISTISISLFDLGYAINPENSELNKNRKALYINNRNSCSGIESSEGEINYIKCAPNTNILYPQNLLPYVHYNINPGNNLYTTYVYGNTRYDNNNSKLFVNNGIKITKKFLFAFGRSYQLIQPSIKQKIHIVFFNIYTKFSYIIHYIFDK